MKYKKIENLEKMECGELVDRLGDLISDAAVEAAKLSTEIEQAYMEKDAAEAEMHKAAGKKDLEAYKEARTRFDMLTEYIAKAEGERSTLEDGRIIDAEDAAKIRRRVYDECFTSTVSAAKKIKALFDEAQNVGRSLNAEIGNRNRVLLMLSECVRPKDAFGERRMPDYYTDKTIGPLIADIEQLQTVSAATYRAFIKNNK